MKYVKIFIPLFILFVIIGGVLLFRINAQNVNTGISIHPSNFDLGSNPGERSTHTIYLDNLTDKEISIAVDRRNFTAQGEEGAINLSEETSTFSLASWINIYPLKVNIPAHQSQKFTFTISVPNNAEPGGHFGSLVFRTIPNNSLKGTGAVLSQEVASLILFKVSGDVVEKANVESFSTDKNFYEFGPVNFDLRIKNEGGVHIQPMGAIAVKGWFGQRFDVQVSPKNVLPNAVRKIPATLNNKLLFGPYNAWLVMSYGSKGEPIYASTVFYAFPVRYGAIVLGALVIIFLMRKRLYKAFKALLTGK